MNAPLLQGLIECLASVLQLLALLLESLRFHGELIVPGSESLGLLVRFANPVAQKVSIVPPELPGLPE